MKKRVTMSVIVLAFMSLVAGAFVFPWGGGLLKKGFIEEVHSIGAASGDIGNVRGNPLRGYEIEDISLVGEDGAILAVSRAGFSLDLKALFSRKVRLARVYLDDVKMDEKRLLPIVENFINEPSEVDVEVGEIDISNVSSTREGWAISSGSISQDRGIWSGEAQGTFRGTPLDGRAQVSVSGDAVSILSCSLSGMGGVASLSGPIMPELGLSGDIGGVSIEAVAGLFSSSGGIHGNVGLDFSISGTLDSPIGSGSVVLDDGAFGRFEIPGLRGDWRYGDSKLRLSNWRGSASGSAISGDMTLAMEEKIGISAGLEAAELDLESWFGDDPRVQGISGRIGSISLTLKGPLDGLSAKVSLEKGDILYSGVKLSGLEGRGEMKESGGLTLDLSAYTLGGNASAKGKVNIGKNRMDLSVALRSIQLGELLPLAGAKGQDIAGAVTGDVKVSGSLDDPVFSGSLDSPSIKAYGIPLSDSKVSFQYDGSTVDLSSISTKAGGGGVSGSGTLRLKKRTEVSIKGDFSGMTGEGLSRAFPDLAGFGLSGTVGGSWSYSSEGAGFGTIGLDLSSKSLSLADAFPLKGLSAQVVVDGKKVEVKKATAGLYGGSLALSGNAPIGTGGMEFKGTLSSIEGAQLMKSMGMEGKGRIDGSFRVSGSSSSPHLDVELGSQRLELAQLALDKLNFTLKTEKDRLVSSLRGALAGVPLTGGGWIRLPSGKDKGAVDLEASVEGLDIKSLLPKGVEIGGTLSTKLHLLGPLGKTKLYAKGLAPRLQVGNTIFSSVELGGYVGQSDVISFEGSSQFGDKRVNVSCDLKPSDKGWSLGFNASGTDVNLYSLASGLEGVVDGRVNMSMKGDWTNGILSASGKLSSKELSSSGVKLRSVSLPVAIKGTSLTVKGGRANLYGGAGTMDLNVDLTKNTWKGRAEVKSADLKPLVKDAASLPGEVSGTVDLRLDMSGVAGRAFLVDITGFLKGRAVELSGFKVLDGVTKGKPFKIRDVSANFNLDGQELYILPGSRISAWPGDEVFRYLEASGSIRSSSGQDKAPLDLSCGGEVNLNALNAFLGAMRSLFKASILEGIKDPRALATDILSGLIGGYSSQEFREISLHVGGTFESPVISKLKINERGMGSGGEGLPSSPGEPRIRIKIDIPTGEGGGQEVEAGDQVKQQIVEGLLKQVVGGSD